MRRWNMLLGMAATAALLASPTGLFAGTVTVKASNGTEKTTAGLTGFATSGNQMAGMLVTATLSTGVESFSWLNLGGSSGGVTGTGWSLTQTGDTFNSPWTLTATNASIVKLVLDGVPGKTVFDRTNPNTGTPGSAQGNDFDVTGGGGAYDITAAYTNILSVIPNAPVGDLYTQVTISFDNRNFVDGTLTFLMDADNATTTITDVPEPSTCALLGIGATALLGYRARRRNLNAA